MMKTYLCIVCLIFSSVNSSPDPSSFQAVEEDLEDLFGFEDVDDFLHTERHPRFLKALGKTLQLSSRYLKPELERVLNSEEMQIYEDFVASINNGDNDDLLDDLDGGRKLSVWSWIKKTAKKAWKGIKKVGKVVGKVVKTVPKVVMDIPYEPNRKLLQTPQNDDELAVFDDLLQSLTHKKEE